MPRLAFVLALALTLILAVASSPPEAAPATGIATTDTSVRPLRMLMVALGQDMARINQGIWHEDHVLVEQGGRGIADHPRISPEQIATIRTALGIQFGAFVQYDKTVHQTAAELAEAATQQDMVQVLDHYAALQRGCVGCHTTFRQKTRTALWEAGGQ